MTQGDIKPTSDASGYRLTFGTLDEARARIGEQTEVCVADCAVNEAMIQYYEGGLTCALVQEPDGALQETAPNCVRRAHSP